MSVTEKISELKAKKAQEPDLAQKRLLDFFDAGSFVEMGGLNKGANVITGYGTVEGSLVFAFSQEGPVDVRHAVKIAGVYDNALKMGAPVVGFMDSNGLKIEEGADAFEAYGILFSKQTEASGIVPQISVVLGNCLGTAALTPMLSDFVIMSKDKGGIFMTSPATFKGLEAKATSYEELGGAESLAKNTSFVDLEFDNDAESILGARKLVAMLPANNMEEAVDLPLDDLNREDEALNAIITDSEEEIDVKSIIKSIADSYDFVELKSDFAKNMVIGLIKLNGATVGVVANNGKLSVSACEKAYSFINVCDAFNIPILSLTDANGYKDSVDAEQRGLIKNSAKLLSAFKNATVPKINVILRNAIGNAYLVMNSKHIGADVVLAWPSAEISLMDKRASLNVMGVSAETYEHEASPFTVSEKGYIDDVIIPAATRKRVLVAFEMLSSKRVTVANRKHSSVQF